MTRALDDVTNNNVAARHMYHRVNNWEARVRGLYHTTGKCLPDGWISHEGQSVRMVEKMMRWSDVATRLIPTHNNREHSASRT